MHTMKVTGGMLGLLIIIIAIGWGSYYYLRSSSQNIEQQIITIETETKQENWRKTSDEIGKIKKTWKKTTGIWSILLDHQEIDNIENSLVRMEKYIETRDRTLALAEAAALKQYIHHIPEKEAFNIKNIF